MNPTTGGWSPTGNLIHVSDHANVEPPIYDPRSADHYWIIVVAYRADPSEWIANSATVPLLDKRNLMSVQGPACYHCEQQWSERISRRRCPGEPRT